MDAAPVVVCIRNRPGRQLPDESSLGSGGDGGGGGDKDVDGLLLHPRYRRTTSDAKRAALDPVSNGNGSAAGRSTATTQAKTTVATTASTYRRWPVTISVNHEDQKPAEIQDPFLEHQYATVFDRYLRDSDRRHWNLQLASGGDEPVDMAASEYQIKLYATALFTQFEQHVRLTRTGTARCQIYIIEQHDSDSGHLSAVDGDRREAGIHCLAWELLESLNLLTLCITVTRVSDFSSLRRRRQSSLQPMAIPPSPASIWAEPGQPIRILLVLARDFSRTGAERDPEPDLAQFPLMNLQRKMKGRMHLEVVRPGSREDLEEHLGIRREQGICFHLVHFDLHGSIRRDESGNEQACLLFAKRHDFSRDSPSDVPRTHLARAELVAQLLVKHRIENVVLNACLSAYNRGGSTANLAHIFLRHGIQNVSAMWYYVRWKTVETYLETFYHELLVKRTDFHAAAYRGREAIRKNPTSDMKQKYQDFFLCVNYCRDVPTNAGKGDKSYKPVEQRDPSPVPSGYPSPSLSVQSQDSSASNNSLKDIIKAVLPKAVIPRLGDNLVIQGEVPMRMKLHLLQLEYKLTTYRIVYASDLRRANMDLSETIDRMIGMWLGTYFIDEVLFYRGKDFAKRKLHTGSVDCTDRRARSGTGSGVALSLRPPNRRRVKALRQKLHVIRDIDHIVDPGVQASEEDNLRSDRRREAAEWNLRRLAEQIHDEGHSYLLFIGSQDAQWWRTYLEHLDGDWWVHLPWSFTVHSRYARDIRLPGEGDRRALTPSPSPLGIR